MARTVEERIIKLQVDNGGVEGALKKTEGSLNSFFNGLKRIGSADPTEGITKGAQNASKALVGIGDQTSMVTSRFTALQTIATGALLTIGSQAVQQGSRLIKALTIDPVMAGFDEYQEKMKAIGIISANTGASMSDINGVLGEMNTYADKTIYSFADMTKNLGTFTAAGVKLDVAKDSIKGISNLAATVGSSSEQAGQAMYQLSQAMASGKVSLQDWNSVVIANMGGEKFQKALEATAAEMGHARDQTKSFRDSLQDGWITSEVLTKTLTKFANDKDMLKMATQARTFGDAMGAIKEAAQSGWANMFEALIGGAEKSTKVWTGLQNFGSKVVSVIPGYFQKIGEAMNDLGNDGVTPMDKIVTAVKSMGDSLSIIFKGPITLVRKAFGLLGDTGMTVFTKTIPNAIKNVASVLEMFAKRVAPLNPLFEKLGSVVASVFRGIMKVIRAVTGFIKDRFKNLWDVTYKQSNDMLSGIGKSWSSVSGLISKPFQAGKDAMDRIMGSFVTSFTSKFGKLQSPLDDFKQAWGNVKIALKNVTETVLNLMKALVPKDTGLGRFLEKLSEKSTNFFDSVKPGKQQWIKDFSQRVLELSEGVAHGSEKFDEFVTKVKEAVKHSEKLQAAFETTKEILKKLVDGFKEAFTIPTVSANSNDGAGGIGDMAGKLKASKDPIGDTLDFITNKFKELNKVLKDPAIKAALITFATIVVAFKAFSVITKNITALTGVLKTFRKNTKSLMTSIKEVPQSISGMFTGISTAMNTLAKGAAQIGLILAWAFAIKKISDALSVLADIPEGEITKGMVAIVTSIAAISAAMIIMNKFIGGTTGKRILAMTASIFAIGLAMELMADAVKLLQGINILSVAFDIGIMTGALAIMAKVLKNGTFSAKAGIALTGVAIAMVALAAALFVISAIPFGMMIGSIIGLTVVLAALGLAGKGLSLGSAAAMLALAVAVGVLAVSIALLSQIPFNDLVVGIAALAVGLLVFIGAMALAGLAAPLIAAIAAPLALLGLAIVALGAGMLLGAIGIAVFSVAFVAAAAAFVVGVGIILAGLVALAPMVAQNWKELLLMGGVLSLIGIALAIFGAGLIIAGAGALIAGIGIGVLAIGLGLIAIVLPVLAAGIVTFVTLMNTLKDSLDTFTAVSSAVSDGLTAIGLGAIAAGLGALVAAVGLAVFALAIVALGLALALGGLLVLAFAASFAKAIEIVLVAMSHIPFIGGQFKQAAADIKASGLDTEAQNAGQGVVDGVASAVTGATDSGKKLGSGAKDGLTQGLAGMKDTGVQGGQDATAGLGALQQGMKARGMDLGQNGENGLGAGLKGMMDTGKLGGTDASNGLGSLQQAMKQNGMDLGTNGESGLGAGLQGMLGTGQEGGSDAASGLRGAGGEANSAGNHVGSQGKDGAKTGIAGMDGIGSNAGAGLAGGLKGSGGLIQKAAEGLASLIPKGIKDLLNIHSPSRVTRALGDYVGQGLALGMEDSSKGVSTKAAMLAGKVTKAMTSIADIANSAIQDGLELSPVITPVLDTSSIQNSSIKGIRIGTRLQGPLPQMATSNKSATIPATTTTSINNNPTFNITQQPGESAEALTDRIEKMLSERTYAI